MSELSARNRRTAVLTVAGIGIFHLVAFGVVVLILGAGRNAAEREVPQRPPLVVARDMPVQDPVTRPQTASFPSAEALEAHWTDRHKDAKSPWTIDAQGRIAWR